MDETRLRELLDDALADEPPMGPVAQRALRAGLRIRRRRRTLTAAGGAAAVAAISVGIATATAIPTPQPPVLGPPDGFIWALDSSTGTATAITPGTGALGKRVRIGGDAAATAVSPD